MENKTNLKDVLNKEHYGFAITLEVIVTLFMLFVFIGLCLYLLNVMNVQRYMHTVLASTASQAARWGGTDSKAYRDNISTTPLLVTAQNQLNLAASGYGTGNNGNAGPTIGTTTPPVITESNNKITIYIDYCYPSFFQGYSKVRNKRGTMVQMHQSGVVRMSITVYSIMEAGKLLG